MLFNFQLRPIEEVAPWDQEGEYSLSWFGLTDGWYWLDCDGHELFRYSDAIIESWKYEGRQPAVPPCVDYQVVRLWGDILQILPDVLSPVPAKLIHKTEPGLEAGLWQSHPSGTKWWTRFLTLRRWAIRFDNNVR
jgi:hypothetical protein